MSREGRTVSRATASLLAVLLVSLLAANASAGLLGTYYNLSSMHPDMQSTITGLDTGYVESMLLGPAPTLTAYGATRIAQFDWWNPGYQAFTRFDSDADLQSGFLHPWFPVNTGLPGDPYHFAVHWGGQFYVDSNKSYDYSMGSDDAPARERLRGSGRAAQALQEVGDARGV
jgi:hypothetical protein